MRDRWARFGRRGGAGGSPSQPFSPADVTGLEAWYRETYSAGTWADLSGNGRDLPVSAGTISQVTRAGQLALSFDGSSYLRAAFGTTLSGPLTFYVVAEQANTSSTMVFFDGNTSPRVTLFASTSAYSLSGSATLSGGTPAAQIRAFCVVANGANSAIYADDFATAAASGDVGTVSELGFTVGANRLGGGPLTGYIWELIPYSAAHDVATRALFAGYLTARYSGLTVTT